MFKKILSVLLCSAMLLTAGTVTAIAEGTSHEHSGKLQKIMTENVENIDFCGEFLCDECGETYYAPVTYADIGMPIINLEGSAEGMTKENEVPMTLTYSSEKVNFTSAASLKWQGGTSVGYPKKNYTVKLLKADGSKNKVKVVESWGKQSKYCLKANWVDASQARNVVSAKIYNEIVHSRMLDDELEALPNGGAVDGFPVAVYENGEFHGLYTFNIPKDNWAWGMNDETLRQALLFAGEWTQSVRLNTPIADVNDPEASGFAIEYCSTEDDPEIGCTWAVESFNEFIDFLVNGTNKLRFRKNASRYFSVERAIDVLIYTCFLHADDNMAKNIVWATYDGQTWIPCMYDMDATWGLFWDGTLSVSPKGSYMGGGNLLFSRLLDYYPDEITARYEELRKDILSKKNIEYYFENFFDSVTDVVKTAEREKWPAVPSFDDNNYTSIYNFATQRMADYDNHYFGASVKEDTRWGGKVMFNTNNGCKFYVYPYEDYTAEPQRAISAYPVNSEGAVVRKDNEVNFKVVPPEGYLVDNVTVLEDSGYVSFSGPETTGENDVYRIKDITSFLNVYVSLSEIPTGYDVTFECPEDADVYVYASSDYTVPPVLSHGAVSVDSATGIPTKSGDGQVNFAVVPHAGYKVVSVEAAPANYKNLKLPEDIGAENTYRITKITGDLTVTVTLEKDAADFIPGDIDADEKITFKDANIMKSIILGRIGTAARADIFADGKVDMKDMNILKQMILGQSAQS